MIGGALLMALVTWAGWEVIWMPHSGLSIGSVAMAAPFWLAGAWLLLRGAAATVRAFRFGRVRVEFDTWPMRTGALVRGYVVVTRGADRLAGVDVRLSLTQHPAIAPKDGSGRRRQVIWSTTAIALPDDPELPAAFAFSFRIPVDAQTTWVDADYDGGNRQEFYTWCLDIGASDGSRANLAHSFDVAVVGPNF